MIKILQIIKNLKETKLFYILCGTSILLSALEYLFIYLVYSLVNFKISGYLPEIYSKVILAFDNILVMKLDVFSYFFLILIFVFFLKTIFYIFYNFFISFFTQRIGYKLSEKILINSLSENKVLNNKINSSFYKNIIIVDVPMFVGSVLQPLFFLVNDTFLFLAILTFLFFHNPLISFYLVLFVFLTCAIFYLYLKTKLVIWGKHRENSSLNLIQSLNEIYKGILEIKIYNVENFFYKKLLKNLNQIRVALTNTNFFIHSPRIILEIIIFVSIFFLLYLVIDEKNNDIVPYLAALSAASIKMIPMFSRIMTSIQGYYFSKLVVQKIFDLIKTKLNQNIFFKKTNKNLKGVQYVKIKNLSCKFQKNVILNKINFTLQKNSITGLSGESGSGKSTIAKIIAGAQNDYSGLVKYYDINDNLLASSPILGSASIIPQDVFVFDDSLMRNISFDRGQNFQFKNNKNFLFLLDKIGINLKRRLGEDGKKISGGQRQRLGIMRSLIFDKDIIIFDESTSSLDRRNKARLFKIINDLKKIKIILIISHDKAFLKLCDKIFILKKGKLNKTR